MFTLLKCIVAPSEGMSVQKYNVVNIAGLFKYAPLLSDSNEIIDLGSRELR